MNNKVLLIKYDKHLYFYTKEGTYIKSIPIYEYLDNLCIEYGSSLNGRLEAFRRITKIKYKPSLIISNKYNIYYIVTHSIRSSFNYLINYSELIDYKAIDSYRTCLIFQGDIKHIIPVNYRIIKRQIMNLKYYLNNMTFK